MTTSAPDLECRMSHKKMDEIKKSTQQKKKAKQGRAKK
jgi:hypothetical protein